MPRRDTPKARRLDFSKTLKKTGVDLALVSNPRHILYLTGLPSNMDMFTTLNKGQRSTSFLAVSSEGEGSLYLGVSETGNPFTGEKFPLVGGFDGKVSTYPDYDLDVRMVAYAPDLWKEIGQWLKSGSAGTPKSVGIEDWNLAAGYQSAVERAFPRSALVGISETLMEMRRSKGSDEVSLLREATRMIDFAFGIAKENVRPGKSELDLYREMNYAAFERFGPYGWITGDVVSGERSLEVGGPATARKLTEGDTVVLDLQAASGGYWSDLARTFVVGRPSPKQARAHGTVIRAKEKAARMLIPGSRAEGIHGAVDSVLTEEGYDRMIHHSGHGIGLDAQERPWIFRASGDTIGEGDVCVIEPGTYRKGIGGVRVEDCYLVTKNGPEKISHFP
ncbi:MAG: Xaa-Pro peptidase family protein, partial [Nitrososphaerales archaeon]